MNEKAIKPIFLLSLPRAGSTMLQRMIASHPCVSTASEPWILLPHMYASRKDGVYAEYGQEVAVDAIEDFCLALPGGRRDYTKELGAFILRLYAKASKPGAKYFLDKTPRYHLLAGEVMEVFPEGKFIYLWRNPLAVAASIMETWNSGRWNLYATKVDLYDGLAELIKAYRENTDVSISIRYEDLLSDPDMQLKRVFEYLELSVDQVFFENFAKVKLNGRMGDPVGVDKYKKVSIEPLEKWKKTFNNPIRKAWARRYLKWIGRERLAIMGYDYDALLAELYSTPMSFKYAGSDIIRILYGMLYCAFDLRPLKYKIKLLSEWHRVHANF